MIFPWADGFLCRNANYFNTEAVDRFILSVDLRTF